MRIDQNYDHTNHLSSSKKWMNSGSPPELPAVLLLLPGDKSRMRIDRNYDHTNNLSSSKKIDELGFSTRATCRVTLVTILVTSHG